MEQTVRECPMCGEKMRLKVRELVHLIPGTTEQKRVKSREWVCPDCEYFEEDEQERPGRGGPPGS